MSPPTVNCIKQWKHIVKINQWTRRWYLTLRNDWIKRDLHGIFHHCSEVLLHLWRKFGTVGGFLFAWCQIVPICSLISELFLFYSCLKSSRGIHRGAYSSDLSWWKSIPIIVSQNRVRSQNAIGCLVFVSQSLFLFKSSTTGRFPVKLKDFPSWKPQVFASCNKSIRYNSSHPFLGSPLDLGKMAILGETVYLIFWHTDILD